ncbi:DNA/RNA non-specific endonuclease [Loigolactobacillus iwatensis]|uniref:DNA/RNA non-specific endonuclease n=1 Tax=Loigolactobacillus iwatensis TaxID=1267156 RepID=UPI000F7DAE3B|nr:DNA/RNA non-specific endonuclease [Loigolactobacillus iwatensis]
MRKKRKTSLTLIAVLLIAGFFGLKPQQAHQVTTVAENIGTAVTQAKNKTNQSSSTTNTKATNSSQLAALNYQSGQDPVVQVNGGKSTLNPADWHANHVIYSSLDSLNRTSSANTAYLESRNVANDALRVRQTVQPAGWHQKFAGKTAILNRGHLVAYSLSKGISLDGNYDPSQQSGDQNNLKNLFTQTAFSNQRIQTIYETEVRDALRAGKQVIYQPHAIFRGNELMPRGVQLQAISTDKTLNFNVYIFNVQPNFVFDYTTGRSVQGSMDVPTPANAPSFNN